MEPEAFERLMLPEKERLLAYLVGMVGDRESALDLAQETYLAAWRGFAGYRGESGALTWLVAIARRIAGRWARRERRRAELGAAAAAVGAAGALGGTGAAGAAGGAPDAAAADAERTRRVRRAVLALPPERRESVVLRYFVGLPVEEIARATGVSTGTVKSRLARARATLARTLASDLA